jgi:hypothetical protein
VKGSGRSRGGGNQANEVSQRRSIRQADGDRHREVAKDVALDLEGRDIRSLSELGLPRRLVAQGCSTNAVELEIVDGAL